MKRYMYKGVDVRCADYYEEQYWSHAKFRTLENKVVDYLRTMSPGASLSLKRYNGEKLAWIISIVCRVMERQMLHKQPMEYIFSDDYSMLKRLPIARPIQRDWRGMILNSY